ncbi:MAG: T9SS type A sorting domain-containing protein [Saprospiraceae bacterium]
MNHFNFPKVSTRNILTLFSFFFLSLFFSKSINAQCCSSSLVGNGNFENTITPNENFPFGIGANNAETGELYEWFYDDGTNTSFAPTFVIDATRATEGSQFAYIPFGGTSPAFNRCIGNSLTYTSDLSGCTVDSYTDGLRYVSHYDWVPFNKDFPLGGTGSTRPTFEFQSPFTILDVYDESGAIVTTNSTAVAWTDIATSWERVYSVSPQIDDSDGIILWYSHIDAATCGILVDDAYFAPLVINSSTASNIQESGVSNQITFELNPLTNLGPVPGVNYSVSAPSGYSISPSSGTYGINTTFTLTINSGTMKDDGDLTMDILVFDEINTSCSVIATVSNPFDIDKDGIVNDLDIDTDGDGLEDTAEYLSLDPFGDEDGDGTLNYEDVVDNGAGDGSTTNYTDSNSDGVPDAFDADLDGLVNHFDLDADNDGIPDLVEAGGVDTNGDGIGDNITDSDGDGLVDLYDATCLGTTSGNAVSQINIGVNNPDNSIGVPGTNKASIGNGDWIELDLGVTIPSGTTIQLYMARNGAANTDATTQQVSQSATSGGVFTNPQIYTSTQNQSVGAEIFNYTLIGSARYIEVRRLSTAAALYGVEFSFTESCTNGIAMPNEDTDNDGLPNSIDLDADNDGIPDLVEAGGIDTNGDGLADVTTDADNDGLVDIYDSDDDGIAGVEDATDPLLMTGGTDTNNDGFANDAAIIFIDGNSNNYDTDGDGYIDGLDLDADNDGIPDIIEAGGISPNSNGMVDVLAAPWDSDNDGLADVYDENNSGTALVETTADTNSDGQVNSTETMSPGGVNIINVDADSYPNHLDLDADNDGITDVVENAGGAVSADNTSGTLDGIVGDNSTVTDSDNNGWHDPSTTATTDSDGDGIPDFLDIDADNDGIVDYLEGVCSTCPTFSLDPQSNPTDANENGVLDIYESLNSSNGTGGSNIGSSPNVDDDSVNSTPDYLDTDSDSDGANDWTEGYDINNDGNAADDLMTMATNYEAATSNGYYVNSTDTDSDGIPDWLDNQPLVGGHNETARPPFLDPASAFWYDDDNDGLVDLLDSSQNGTAAPTPDNNGGNDLDWRDMTTFASLPVELSNFSADEKDCRVKLNWKTETEVDFDYFEIQWSGDGHEFTRIGLEKSIGNENGTNYSFTDKTPSEFNYYRLKMVDLDNSFEYSKVISKSLDCKKLDNQINIYPNPISPEQGMLNVEFYCEKTETQLSIVDLLGRTVSRLSLEVEPEMTNYIQIDISHLPAGTYSLQQIGTKTSNLFIIQE